MIGIRSRHSQQVTRYSAIIGRILGEIRRQQNLPQEHVADALRISQSAYSRIEKGATAMSVDQLHAAARALGISPTNLMRRAERMEAVLHAQGIDIIHERDPIRGAEMITGAALGLLLGLLFKKR